MTSAIPHTLGYQSSKCTATYRHSNSAIQHNTTDTQTCVEATTNTTTQHCCDKAVAHTTFHKSHWTRRGRDTAKCMCVYVHEYAVATRSHSSDGPPTKQGRIVCAHCTQRADMAARGEGRGGRGHNPYRYQLGSSHTRG